VGLQRRHAGPDAVASPETEGLAPGWTGAMMGMMTTVRVLPPDRYDAIMARVRSGEGRTPAPPHSHHEGG
jgi:manganese oxidase